MPHDYSIGETMRIYRFEDGEFEFFTASLGDGITITFRVRTDTFPEKRAQEKSILFNYLRPASVREIELWMKTHPDYPTHGTGYEPA